MPIVDAHHHLWDLARGYYPLRHGPTRPGPARDGAGSYLPAHYRHDVRGYDVVATVHVEAAHDPDDPVAETRWLAEQRRATAIPTVIVGYADLRSPLLQDTLDGHLRHAEVRGIRQMLDVDPLSGGPLRDALGDDRWVAGLRSVADRGLVFVAQLDTEELPRLAEVLSGLRDLRVVLCHAGLRGPGALSDRRRWVTGLERLAACPNVTVAVSGLGSLLPAWDHTLAASVTRTVLDVLGPRRAMFASNFPVDRPVVTFGQLVAAARTATAHLPVAEQQEFFAGTAQRVYRLPSSVRRPGVV
ncbi:amidohydrolase family protein [Jiangella asiatica]|uniref:Amidohydrolase-related domain-containing protein n=1 Tax=Jiangella asiatica TaxID=2530372 RepID=A0A4R5DQ61_9ACTN|nr:amidohydrolase family protein [Jiangella asiatica]TDE14191.1 hypothetical protein E1269_03230 [Jiangella asiatica]